MLESGYQKKIIDAIKKDGGTAFTGSFPTGQADIVAGILHNNELLYCEIEVKTPHNYNIIMSCVDNNYNVINDTRLKKHEFLQITKLRLTREKGGLALIAHSYDQVKEYINDTKNTPS